MIKKCRAKGMIGYLVSLLYTFLVDLHNSLLNHSSEPRGYSFSPKGKIQGEVMTTD